MTTADQSKEMKNFQQKMKKTHQNKPTKNAKGLPTIIYTWYFEWIHFLGIDIGVIEVPPEYFTITYFSFD